MPLFLRILGLLLLISPLFLHWLIHGDYKRYLAIINGPYPLSHMGSAPFQMVMYIILFIAGVLIVFLSFRIKRPSKKRY